MNNTETTAMTKRQNGNGNRGFSLIEMVVVISIILILSAMAIYQIGPGIEGERANTAMRQVVEQLRQARELAIEQRRWVAITFPVVVNAGSTEYRVQAVIKNSLTLGAGPDVALPPQPIQQPITFQVFGAPVTDTPDLFGNAGAIDFEKIVGGPIGGMLFDSDGELVDGTTLTPISGTVFLGTVGQMQSVRAVTVMGTTGRIRGYSWNGTTWVQF